MKWIMLVAGGAFGTVSRYLLSGLTHRFLGHGFPYGTLVVNTIGCLLIGFLVTLIDRQRLLTPEQKLFCLVGFLGAFTTFSTFMLETVELTKDGHFWIAAGNVLASVLFGLIAIRVGIILGNMI